MVKAIKHDTYVEATVKGVRLTMNPLDLKDNEYVVIIQRPQKEVDVPGEGKFVDLGLSWLPASEAMAVYGEVVADMVKLLDEIDKAVCGRCGKTVPIKELKKHDGTVKCPACAKHDIKWYADWKAKCNANRAANGEPALADNDPLCPWKGKLEAVPLA